MKRIMMVLPLAVLLAYCSGPNNTQKTTDTDMNGTSNSVSASTTETTNDVSTRSTDVSDVNTNSSAVNTDGTNGNKADIVASSSNSAMIGNTSNYGSISTTGSMNMDTSDPMYQHFQRINGSMWTWDLNYPGYDRPTAGTYNSAINGNWQLVMTPELVSAWRQDNSRSLWSSGYAYDGRLLSGNTYLSASESFNTKNNTRTLGLNNSASANSSVTNKMNGNTSNSSTMATNNNANPSINGSAGGAVITNGGTTGSLSGSVNAGADLNSNASISSNMDLNSINYNAANGNMYQVPKFNLYLDNGSFTGYTGCNSVSGRVAVTGTSLHFLNTTPSTNIDCLGGLDQAVFLNILRRVDSYAYVGDELQLMQGNQVLLKFRRGGSLQ